MSRTTIELSEERKEQLREARLPHESNYDETIARLLGNPVTDHITESEARKIANEQIAERVMPEAQR